MPWMREIVLIMCFILT